MFASTTASESTLPTTAASATLPDARQRWTIDGDHTLVEFSVKHMMVATVKGRFTAVSGTVTTTGPDFVGARLEVTIDAASIATGVGARDDHLRSADFFEVDRFPTLAYRSRLVERTGPDSYRVIGDLTIRDVTREVVLAVEETGRHTDDSGNPLVGLSATTRIRRHDFGLGWNQALEAGGVLVGEEVRISLEVELVGEAAISAAA